MTQPSVSLACLAGSPLTELHHRAGIFSLSFQGLVAAGMPSGKPKNKTACASRDEYRGRVLRGSDRSAHSRLGPNCCFGQVIRKPQNNYGRSSQTPLRAPGHVRSMARDPSIRWWHQTSKWFVGVAKKSHTQDLPGALKFIPQAVLS